ncbi:uncharacterized protein LOC143215600 [Lasioglossum baleicum]|uniref:uncharacterized protein LOC143215600 n=1 Tax=Lasioglossum baleicum TaxID=434251 RepID=UPI003FCD6D77
MVQQPRLRFSGSGNPKSHNVIRQLVLVVVVNCLLTPVQSVNGVIWDKQRNDFVPIVSKPIFAAMNQEFLSRSREEETHNFQGRAFKFSYYEIDDVIFAVENGTRVSGYIGETWNILAEYLNLTLKPDRSSLNTLGFKINGTFTPGLLKTIQLNQTDIVARVELVSIRMGAAQFTLPLKCSRRVTIVKFSKKFLQKFSIKILTPSLNYREIRRRIPHPCNPRNESTPLSGVIVSQFIYSYIFKDVIRFLCHCRNSFLMKPKRQHVTTWMLKLYSRKVWFAILITYIILSVCSYVFRVIEAGMFKENMIPGMADYFFYNLGMICTQNCNTSSGRRCSRLIEYLASLFALLINTAFNAVIFGYMSQVVSIFPFYNTKSILESTQYSIIAVNGSSFHEAFAGGHLPDHSNKSRKKRIILVRNLTDMYTRLCSDELMTTFSSDEIGKNGNYACQLQTVGLSMVVSIVSAISWQFKNKRSIDIALMKLYENGILQGIHRRWLKWWQEDDSSGIPEAVVLEQVHFVYMVLLGGLFMSLIILVLEQITFHCNK